MPRLDETYQDWYIPVVTKLRVAFYRTASGREPVREWLRSLDRESKKIIGDDIKMSSTVGRSVCHWFGIWEPESGKSAVSSEMALHESSLSPRKT